MFQRLAERLNHEYWPWQLIYLPVLPLYLWQALKQRRAAFFTNVNPAIDMGGFFGERKSHIYALLPAGCYPETLLIPSGSNAHQVLSLWRSSAIGLPAIVKPDVGERGQGIEQVHDEARLVKRLTLQPQDMLLQALITEPAEYGLMFARDMATGAIDLLSVTGKRFLSVRGDGLRPVVDLLRADYRGSRQLARLLAHEPALLNRVPAQDEILQIEPIGNHCRGTRFFDANALMSPALRASVDALLRGADGINYGRLDVRSCDDLALRAGRFTVIELNGVSSEPGLIYDPRYSIFRCWGVLVRHVRRMAPISSTLQRKGEQPCTLHALVRRCETHFGWRLRPLPRLMAWFE